MPKLSFVLVAGACLVTALLAAFPAPLRAQVCACPGIGIRADRSPPPLPVYDQPAIPGPGYIWTPGYWSWNNYDYYWVPGTWIMPPQPDLLWTPGYWAFSSGVYVFNAGYWGHHVGFYGGIAYGFGYAGAGYEGGYWNGGRFFYNRTVNNFGTVNITNVYNKTVVVNNTTINRVSYNGGTGGIAARPSVAEEAAGREPHIQPTPAQIGHIRAASTNGALFEVANHGRPAVSATPHPWTFGGTAHAMADVAGKPANDTLGAPQQEDIKVIPGGKPLPVAPPGISPAIKATGKPESRTSSRPLQAGLQTKHQSVPPQQARLQASTSPRSGNHVSPRVVPMTSAGPRPQAPRPQTAQHSMPRQAFRPQMSRHPSPRRPAPHRACGPHQRC